MFSRLVRRVSRLRAFVALAVSLMMATALGVAVVPGTAGAAKLSGAPIIVGNIGPYTSTALGPEERDLAATPTAWVDWTNAHGGINGHPVKLIEMNDNFDPGQAVTDIHKLVADKIVALVYDEDIGLEVAYTPYLQQQGIPVVGGQNYDTIWEQNSDLFPTMATVSFKGYADDYAAKFAHIKTLAEAYCTEVAACLQDVQAQKAAASQLGITVDIGPSASIAAPNYTAQCVALSSYHAQGYYFSAGVQGVEQMALDCARQGFKGTWVLPQPDDTELQNAALSKFTVGQDLSLSYFAKLPQTKDFRSAMAKYASGVPLQINSLRIWSAFDVFKQALINEKGKTVTPQVVTAGLYKLHNFSDHGLVPPLTYQKGQGHKIKCFEVWEIKNGKFILPQGDHFNCAP